MDADKEKIRLLCAFDGVIGEMQELFVKAIDRKDVRFAVCIMPETIKIEGIVDRLIRLIESSETKETPQVKSII